MTNGISSDDVLLRRARQICADHDPNKGYQYLEGQRDDYPPMTMVLTALSARATSAAADVGELEDELANLMRLDDPVGWETREEQIYAINGEQIDRTLTALRGAQGWQPIETAPKNA